MKLTILCPPEECTIKFIEDTIANALSITIFLLFIPVYIVLIYSYFGMHQLLLKTV